MEGIRKAVADARVVKVAAEARRFLLLLSGALRANEAVAVPLVRIRASVEEERHLGAPERAFPKAGRHVAAVVASEPADGGGNRMGKKVVVGNLYQLLHLLPRASRDENRAADAVEGDAASDVVLVTAAIEGGFPKGAKM